MTTARTIILAADHGGYLLKQAIADHCRAAGLAVEDLGTDSSASCDYPQYAHAVCQRVLVVPDSLGILVCGTGMGMSMAANRHPGIRAALCANEFYARMAREHNDANVLCLGERVLGPGLALAVVDAFLATPFGGGRHLRRIQAIDLS